MVRKTERLSQEDREKIFRLHQEEYLTVPQLQERFQTSATTIHVILKEKRKAVDFLGLLPVPGEKL